MLIPEEYFLFINVAVILIFIIFAVFSYNRGMLLQIISLGYTALSVFVAWFLAPILAVRLPIVKLETLYNLYDVNPLVNSLVYFIIIFIAMRILYLFIAPLFKSLSKVPFLGSVNKFGGLIIGIINAFIVVILVSLLLSTPLVKNGQEVKENTIFKYAEKISDYAVKLTVDHLNFDALKEKISGFNADEARDKFTNWLIDQGILNE